ncbi:Defensin-like protein [Medicago truncatula]|uniref:Defensin-like protein n=1 Tax=Medicago truncatula TaxID=3880 RepID=A0A072TLQ5_MEDTR|nr:Defensin-like protein [Medicago truncatula]
MTSSARKFYAIFLFLSFALLLFSTLEVQALICKRRSITWHRPCPARDNVKCENHCINKEHALIGSCQPNDDSFELYCFCYFGC